MDVLHIHDGPWEREHKPETRVGLGMAWGRIEHCEMHLREWISESVFDAHPAVDVDGEEFGTYEIVSFPRTCEFAGKRYASINEFGQLRWRKAMVLPACGEEPFVVGLILVDELGIDGQA